jgi:hypothetical protein
MNRPDIDYRPYTNEQLVEAQEKWRALVKQYGDEIKACVPYTQSWDEAWERYGGADAELRDIEDEMSYRGILMARYEGYR